MHPATVSLERLTMVKLPPSLHTTCIQSYQYIQQQTSRLWSLTSKQNGRKWVKKLPAWCISSSAAHNFRPPYKRNHVTDKDAIFSPHLFTNSNYIPALYWYYTYTFQRCLFFPLSEQGKSVEERFFRVRLERKPSSFVFFFHCRLDANIYEIVFVAMARGSRDNGQRQAQFQVMPPIEWIRDCIKSPQLTSTWRESRVGYTCTGTGLQVVRLVTGPCGRGHSSSQAKL